MSDNKNCINKQAVINEEEFIFPKNFKKTKLIATIGPASENEATLKNLISNGLTTIRLNFSHGDHDEHGKRIDIINKFNQNNKFNFPISIMFDTKGPEIRIGQIVGKKMLIEANSELVIYCQAEDYQTKAGATKSIANHINSNVDHNFITMSYDISKTIMKGQEILIDDGKLKLVVIDVSKGIVITRALNKHWLEQNKRVNIPGLCLALDFLSTKDKADLKFGVKKGIDYIAASFVNSKNDILAIRDYLASLVNDEELQAIPNLAKRIAAIKIIAKIESQYGINNIDEIIAAADGIMVARGDLGIEVDYFKLPRIQEMIMSKVQNKGKFVIVATQMLESMTEKLIPTRAEVTDVYFAVKLGSDATMLSGETANGVCPVEAVNKMALICQSNEDLFYQTQNYHNIVQSLLISNPAGKKIYQLLKKIDYAAYQYIIIPSSTGEEILDLAALKPNCYIIGFVDCNILYTKFGCYRGVYISKLSNLNTKVDNLDQLATNEAAVSEIAKHWGCQIGAKVLLIDLENDNNKIIEFTVK